MQLRASGFGHSLCAGSGRPIALTLSNSDLLAYVEFSDDHYAISWPCSCACSRRCSLGTFAPARRLPSRQPIQDVEG